MDQCSFRQVLLQLPKSFLLALSPHKWLVCAGEDGERLGYLGVVSYEASVVPGQT